MKVYALWYDNGEQYEDSEHYIDVLYTTRELALREMNSRGYTREDNNFKGHYRLAIMEKPTDKCKHGVMVDGDDEPCYECQEDDCYFSDWYNYESDKSWLYVEEIEVIE